ncbi:NAD(P)/FAD-dependent oxidoreductase [Nocardia sp. NPDC059239]|uniref:NAD(P)/FAD-dependent oxidoreductase n=1 Tax=unclassified Nocardia TaxID=2637762 RepID=UPI0036AF90A6
MSNDDAVVVIGAGQGGFQVAHSLRSGGFTGSIDLVGGEAHLPYQRPPLSKDYLRGSTSIDGLRLANESFFPEKGIQVHRGDPAVAVDRSARCVHLGSGSRLDYSNLVFATGARPRTLPVPGSDLQGVVYLRGIDDADLLRKLRVSAEHVVVIGGGFIGLEFAAVERAAGRSVTVVEGLDRPLSRALSPEMSSYLTSVHAEQGTHLLLGRTVNALHGLYGSVTEVELDDGTRLKADIVVIGVGVIPNVEVAARAGLHTDNGIVVDERLRTSDHAITAVGDCATFPSLHADDRLVRLESVQNAVDQAKFVAAGIIHGARNERYNNVPWFWSHQFDCRVQMAGLPTPDDRRIVHGDITSGRFSVLRFDDERLTCVESVNRPADHMAARKILATTVRPTPDNAEDPQFTLQAFAKGGGRPSSSAA